MDFFELNRRAIEKHAGYLLKIFDTLPPAPPAVETGNGQCSVKIGEIRIAGSVDPGAEGKKFAKSFSNANGVLVYGFGLGYHIEALLERSPARRVTVIEANYEILSAALHHRDLSAIFANNYFSLVTGIDDEELAVRLSKTLRETGEEKEVAIHPPSYSCMPKRFPELKNLLEAIRTERRFKGRFAKQEEANIIKNINAVSASKGVASLFGVLRGKPALLVGAGPSLDCNLPLLIWLQKKVFIMAVDTAAAVLSDVGISCHAVISIDPQPASVFHFGARSALPLIFFPTTHPWVVENHKGRRLAAIQKSHPFFQRAEHLVMDKGASNAGGSASCVGLDILVQMGANPIGIIGQDFAFTKGLPHNRRTFSWGMAHEPALRQSDRAAMEALALHENLKIESVNGRSVATHANLLSYLKNFEGIISKNPDRRFYNIGSSGAAIHGCENIRCAGEVYESFGAGGNPPVLRLPEETPNPELALRLRGHL